MSTIAAVAYPLHPENVAAAITRLLGLPARFENTGGGIGAIVVHAGRDREVLLGSADMLLDVTDGQTVVATWSITGQYLQDHRHAEEATDLVGIVSAVRRAFVAARAAR